MMDTTPGYYNLVRAMFRRAAHDIERGDPAGENAQSAHDFVESGWGKNLADFLLDWLETEQ